MRLQARTVVAAATALPPPSPPRVGRLLLCLAADPRKSCCATLSMFLSAAPIVSPPTFPRFICAEELHRWRHVERHAAGGGAPQGAHAQHPHPLPRVFHDGAKADGSVPSTAFGVAHVNFTFGQLPRRCLRLTFACPHPQPRCLACWRRCPSSRCAARKPPILS